MHYYQFNIGDYISHTSHLDDMEDLAYRRMLDWYYLHESPLPNNIEQIAKLIRMRTHTESIANVLNEFFILSDYGWSQKKADEQIGFYQSKSEKAKASANARWGNKPNANALKAQCDGNANHKTITNNQKPLTINILFSEFWDIYPRKEGKKKASDIWAKIKVDAVTFDEMKSHIEFAYKDSDVKFVPHATTYLNQQRWLDGIGGNVESIPYQQIADEYDSVCTKLENIQILTDSRKDKIRKIWNSEPERQNVKFFSSYFGYVNSIPNLTGSMSNGWKADIDWLMNIDNLAKVLERKYL